MMGVNCTASDRLALKQFLGQDASAVNSICSSTNVSQIGITSAVLHWTVDQIHSTELQLTNVTRSLNETKASMDVQFVLQNSYTVFLMQAGFALYAAGVIRSKNTFNILMKGFIDVCVSGVMFYLFGYAFANDYGNARNGFIGTANFGLASADEWQKFLFQWSFCAASTTVVSGAVAERVTFFAYLVYSIFISAWVYPVAFHWTNAPVGWLTARNQESPLLGVGAVDFAGAGFVHIVAGFASLVGAYLVGCRIGRFDPGTDPSEFKGRSASTFVLGTFLLWYGWYGFNPGSYLSISSAVAAGVVSRIAIVTTLSASAAGVTSALLVFYHERSWDLLATCSGLLAGLVASTACCSVVSPWAGLLVGFGAAYVYHYSDKIVCYFKVDDPVSAFAMHGCCGVYSLLVTGLLADEGMLHEVYNVTRSTRRQGVFMGGDGSLLACQLAEAGALAGWSAFWAIVVFGILKNLDLLRVDTIEEVVGMDVYTHGEVLAGGLLDPNATKFAGGPANFPGTPVYAETPNTGGTPVTLRMDSRGNMRWTPRHSQSLDHNIVSGTAMGNGFGGATPSMDGPDAFKNSGAFALPMRGRPGMDINGPSDHEQHNPLVMGHPHVSSFK